MPDKKLSVQEFASKIRSKYPAYDSYDDVTLVNAVIEKYPVYAESVDYNVKKKESTASESLVTDLPSPSQKEGIQGFDTEEVNKQVNDWYSNWNGPNKGVDASEPTWLQGVDRSFGQWMAETPIVSQLVGGSNRFVGGVLDIFNGVVKESSKMIMPDNPLTDKLKEGDTFFQELAETYNQNANTFKTQRAMGSGFFNPGLTQEELDKGFWNNVKEGNVVKGTWLLLDGITENIPSIVVGMSGGAIGTGALTSRVTGGTIAMGVSSAGSKYRQIEDDPRYSPAEKLAFSFAQGAVETLTESMFRGDLDAAKSILSNPSKSSILRQDFIATTRASEIYRNMRKMGNEEGFEEVIVETWDIVTTGIKEGKSIEEINSEIPKIIDAYAMGFGSGGGIQLIANGRAARGSLKNEESRRKSVKTIQAVNDRIEKLEDPQKINTAKQLIQEEKRKLQEKIEEDKNYYSKFSEEDREKVVKIDNELAILEQQLDLITDPELRIERERQALNLLSNRKEIHGKYPQDTKEEKSVDVVEEDIKPTEATEPALDESTKVSDVIGQRATINGNTGVITSEGGGKISLYTDNDKIIDIGNLEEIGDQSLESAGIEVAGDIVSIEDGNILVRGKKYNNNYSNPLAAINRDKDGNIISVTLDAENGSKRTFKGNTADELAYNIVLSQYENQELESELENLYNTDEETRQLIDEIESIKENASKTKTQDTEQASTTESKVIEEPAPKEELEKKVEEKKPAAPSTEVKAETKKFQDSDVILKEETFTVIDKDGGKTVTTVRTNLDGSLRKAEVESFDADGNSLGKGRNVSLADNDIVVRDGLTAEQILTDRLVEGQVIEKTERSGNEINNPKKTAQLTTDQKQKLGIPTQQSTAVETEVLENLNEIDLGENETIIENRELIVKGEKLNFTIIEQTSEKDGIKTTKYQSNRSNKSSDQRSDSSVSPETVLNENEEINLAENGLEDTDGNTTEVTKVFEVREDANGVKAAEVEFTVTSPDGTKLSDRGTVKIKQKAKDTAVKKPVKTEKSKPVAKKPKPKSFVAIPLDDEFDSDQYLEKVTDNEGNTRLFARYPVKGGATKLLFEVVQTGYAPGTSAGDNGSGVKRVSDKSYGRSTKELKKRLAKEEPTVKNLTTKFNERLANVLDIYTDNKDANIEIDIIEDSGYRITVLNEDIEIEKGNILEMKEDLKSRISDIKSSDSFSKEGRILAIEEAKEQHKEDVESILDQIGIYKEDIKQYKRDSKKAEKRLDKLKKPVVKEDASGITTIEDEGEQMSYEIFGGGKSWNKATAMGKNFLLKIKEGMLFNGTAKIEATADIAYLFRHLRKANSENAFAVVYNDEGDYLTAWLGSGETSVDLDMLDIVKFIENSKQKLGSKVNVSLVHNHPSGKVRASKNDKDTWRKMYEMYNSNPDVKVGAFVIINLDSGKYGVYNDRLLNAEAEELTSVKEEKEFNVYELDKDVLYSKYNGARKMYSSKEIVELFSQIKAGDTRSHLGYAILDPEGSMMFSSIVDTDNQKFGDGGYNGLIEDITSNMLAYNGNQLVFFDTISGYPATNYPTSIPRIQDIHKKIQQLTKERIKSINNDSSKPMSFNEDVPLVRTKDKTPQERLKEGYNPVTKEDVFGSRKEAALNSARRFMDKMFWNKVQAKVISAKEVKSSMMAQDSKKVNDMANSMSKLLKPSMIARLIGKKGLDKSFIKLANQYFTGSLKQKNDALIEMRSSSDPKAGKFIDLIVNMRAYVDARSTRILNDQMYESLPDETKEIIEDNLGSYVHRSYYFFDHPFFKISKNAKTKAIAEQHKIFRIEAYNKAMSENMGITEDEAIDIVNKKDAFLKRKAREDVLSTLKNWSNQKGQSKKSGSKSTSDSGLKIDESALIARKDIPPHIREMLGEIKDPVGKFVSTANALNAIHRGSEMASTLIDVLSSTSMYEVYSQEMYDKPWGKLSEKEKSIVTKRSDENSLIKNDYNIKEKEKSTYKQISNPLSPLHGKYVHEDVLDVLEETPIYVTQFNGMSGFTHQIYLNILKASRQTKVLGNLPTWGKNFIGGIYFATINGVVNPQYFLKTSLNFGKKIAKGDKTYDNEVKEMSKYGLIGRDVTSSTIGMSAMLFNYSMGKDASTYNKYIAANRGKWKMFVRDLGSKYASIDDFTKMIIYGYEKKSFALKLYGRDYYDLSEQEQEKVQETAAERVKENTPTFSRMFKFTKQMLKLPFGDFIGFKAESARSLGMTIKNMMYDFQKGIDGSNNLTRTQRAEYIKDSSKKLLGLSVVLSNAPYLVLKELIEGQDGPEEEEIRRLAKMITPGWLKTHKILVKDIDQNLNITVYDYTGFDPYGTVFSSHELLEIIKPNMAVQQVYNLIEGKDVYGKPISDPTDPAFQQWYDKSRYFIGNTYVPPNVSSSYRDAKKAKTQDPDVNVTGETFKIMSDRLVVRSYKYNMVQQFRYQVKEFELSFKENYTNTDWGETRKAKLSEIREQYLALNAVASSRGNFKAMEDAQKIIARTFDDAEEYYILYNLDLTK